MVYHPHIIVAILFSRTPTKYYKFSLCTKVKIKCWWGWSKQPHIGLVYSPTHGADMGLEIRPVHRPTQCADMEMGMVHNHTHGADMGLEMGLVHTPIHRAGPHTHTWCICGLERWDYILQPDSYTKMCLFPGMYVYFLVLQAWFPQSLCLDFVYCL